MKENNSNIDKSSITMLWMAGSILLLLETLWFLTSIIKLPWLDILYYALTLSLWINIVRLSKKVNCLQQLLVIRASMEENSCPIEAGISQELSVCRTAWKDNRTRTAISECRPFCFYTGESPTYQPNLSFRLFRRSPPYNILRLHQPKTHTVGKCASY